MLPQLKHRLIIGLGLVIGGLCWLFARGALVATDGSGGLSLMDAHVGAVVAVLVVIAAGLPAIACGLIAAATGNPLAGAFTVSGSLVLLASMGGSINGYLLRADLPAGYRQLAIESVIWVFLLALAFAVIERLRTVARPKLQALASKKHLGTRTHLASLGMRPVLAGVVAAAAGAFLCNLLIRSSDGGQVNGSLMLGFGTAALIANMVVPQRNPVLILFSPLIVGIATYLWVAASYPTHDALLVDLYGRHLTGLALALPIQYASSGVAGCAMGVGLAQTLEQVRHTTIVTA